MVASVAEAPVDAERWWPGLCISRLDLLNRRGFGLWSRRGADPDSTTAGASCSWLVCTRKPPLDSDRLRSAWAGCWAWSEPLESFRSRSEGPRLLKPVLLGPAGSRGRLVVDDDLRSLKIGSDSRLVLGNAHRDGVTGGDASTSSRKSSIASFSMR